MWQFSECIRGISDACNALGTPVVSGNVSFYNETEGSAIDPTPTVGMVGLIEDERIGTDLKWAAPQLDIILLGETRDELGGSEWQQMQLPDALAAPPRVDLERERALIDLLISLQEKRLVRSAHDISNGGLAVALAESSMNHVGCHVDLRGHADDIDAVALLFSESQGRAVVSCHPDHRDEIIRLANDAAVPAMRIGHTAFGTFVIERNGVPIIRTTAPELERIWSSAFGLLIAGDSIDDVIRDRGEEVELIPH